MNKYDLAQWVIKVIKGSTEFVHLEGCKVLIKTFQLRFNDTELTLVIEKVLDTKYREIDKTIYAEKCI